MYIFLLKYRSNILFIINFIQLRDLNHLKDERSFLQKRVVSLSVYKYQEKIKPEGKKQKPPWITIQSGFIYFINDY